MMMCRVPVACENVSLIMRAPCPATKNSSPHQAGGRVKRRPRSSIGVSLGRVLLILGFGVLDAGHGRLFADEPTAPFLRIEADGPLAYVTALGFREDPITKKLVLHATGWDKTVHAWTLTDGNAAWRYDRAGSLRVPIGPAFYGSANAMAISADGDWVAVGGRGFVRGFLSQETQTGWVLPSMETKAMDDEMSLDEGTVFVFHLPTGTLSRLRGHAGPVLGLTFADGPDPVLVSAAVERQGNSQAVGKLRVWDVRNKRELARLNHLPNKIVRPGLTAWRTGKKPESVRVGIAWSDVDSKDDKVRVWDVGNNQLAENASGVFPSAICRLPGSPQRILTGVIGEIGNWTTAPPDRKLEQFVRDQHYRTVLSLPPRNGFAQTLVSAAAFPAPSPQGALAVGIVYDMSKRSYRLIALAVDSGKVLHEMPLWQNVSRVPILAVDPQGQFIAVSGNDDHEVWVIRSNDLIAGKSDKTVLKSLAQSISSVAFAKYGYGEDLSVVINAAASERRPAQRLPHPGDRLFHIAGREFTTTSDWQTYSADDSGWTVVERSEGRKVWLDVSLGPSNKKSIELFTGDRLETWAGCPATDNFPEPLLAVSIQNRTSGDSQLWIINPETGAWLRQLNGHVDRITALAFSQDGKFLVSSSLDHTFRLWELSDLKQSLESHAGLFGLEVAVSEDGRIIVKADRSNRFSAGDTVSVVDPKNAEKVLKFESAYRFFRFINDQKPGDLLSVDVKKQNEQKTTRVELSLGRRTDERKPLSSVFVFAQRPEDPVSWIGWDPLGRYDSTRAESESRLGWHFNTDDADAPVLFAPAEKYREQNYWPGLIADHLEQGAELAPRVKPEPNVSLYLRQGTRIVKTAPDQPAMVRTGSLSAFVQVSEFPDRQIERVTWKAGSEERPFTRTAEGLWETELDAIQQLRDLVTLVASVTTSEKPARTVTRELTFRIVPTMPVIRVTPELPTVVTQESLDVDVNIQSQVFDRSESTAVKLTLLHEGKEIDVQQWEATESKPSRRKVALRAGANVLKIVATNTAALPEMVSLEQSEKTFSIRLTEAQRPEIQIRGVAHSTAQDPILLDLNSPWITDQKSIHVQGTTSVNTPDQIVKAEYRISGQADPISLNSFNPASSVDFKQEIPITQPGKQTITFTVTSNRGMVDRVSFDVIFLPTLPSLDSVNLTQKGIALPSNHVLIEGQHQPELTFQATLNPPLKEVGFTHPVKAILRLKSRDNRVERSIDFSSDTAFELGEALPLKRGENFLQLILKSDWAEQIVYRDRFVYRQPPRIIDVQLPTESDEPTVDLHAKFVSTTPPVRFHLLRNGFEIPWNDDFVRPDPDQQDSYIVKAPVPLDVDGSKTRVEFWVENLDGESISHSKSTSTYIKPRPPIPEIHADYPDSVRTQDPTIRLQFRIRTPSSLQRITIKLDRGSLRSWEIPIEGLPAADSEGFVTIVHPFAIDQVEERSFKFFVEATNAAGSARTMTTEVNYLLPPIPLIVDELRPVGGSPLKRRGAQIIHFEPAKSARLELKGHLKGKNLDHARVKIWVNGFLQRSVNVEEQGRFTANVVLNLETANRISFEVPHLALDEIRLPKLVVDCQAHQRPASLRLITVLAPDPQRGMPPADMSAQHLQNRILSAMRLQNPSVSGFKLEPGPVLDGDFTDNDLTGALAQMILIMNREGDEPTNDVLVMYYQGAEVNRTNSDFELATGNPRITVKRTSLVNLLCDIPGAHLLLLDVQRLPQGAREQIWSDTRLGLLHVAWAERPQANPKPFRLVDALEKSVGSNAQRNLVNVASLVDQTYREIRRTFPYVSYYHEIPEELQRLVLTP